MRVKFSLYNIIVVSRYFCSFASQLKICRWLSEGLKALGYDTDINKTLQRSITTQLTIEIQVLKGRQNIAQGVSPV